MTVPALRAPLYPVRLQQHDGGPVDVDAARFRVVLENEAGCFIWLDRALTARAPDLTVRESKAQLARLVGWARCDAIIAGRDRERCGSYPPLDAEPVTAKPAPAPSPAPPPALTGRRPINQDDATFDLFGGSSW